MANVDPYVTRIPVKLTNQDGTLSGEGRAWFNYLDRWLHDMWIRSGGGNDNISQSGIKQLYNQALQTSEENTQDLLNIAYSSTQPVILADGFELITVATGDTAFTTTGNQVVICNNTAAATITLNALPDDGEELHIKRRDTSVTVSGTVDGNTSTPIPSKFDSMHLVFTLAAAEWSII